jgi:hypothetical protein
MKNPANVTNPHTKNILIAESPFAKSSTYQEAEFTDKLICTQTQTNLTPSKANKRVL